MKPQNDYKPNQNKFEKRKTTFESYSHEYATVTTA